jgi:hypothetical protein
VYEEFNRLKLSGKYKLNARTYVLAHALYVSYIVLTINSDHFSLQHSPVAVSVFCVKYGLNIYRVRSFESSSGRTMAQAVSRRPLTAKAQVRSRASPCEMYVSQSGTGAGFSPSISVFLCRYQCSITILVLILLVSEGQAGEALRLKSSVVSDIDGEFDRKALHFVFKPSEG